MDFIYLVVNLSFRTMNIENVSKFEGIAEVLVKICLLKFAL